MVESESDRERRARLRGLGERGRMLRRGGQQSWEGESAAIYCRISHVADEDQTGVDRQERICRDLAGRLGLTVDDDHVLVDNNRSAWQRSRKRKGWNAMLELARSGRVRHIVTYHPDRLMRQPKDLEALLDIADTADITVHGQANRRDLTNPDDRFFLRIEVAHACKSSDDTSRRMTEAMVDRAFDGKPHTGPRRYGYSADGMTVIEPEAEVIRRIFREYVDGTSPVKIIARLNGEGIPTVRGKTWTDTAIRDLLDSRYHAGILVFRGEEIGPGSWPAIIDADLWKQAREARTVRASRWRASLPATERFYLLRGVIMCGRCGTRMSGRGGPKAKYGCTRAGRRDEWKCARSILAAHAEPFVVDAAMHRLETLDLTGAVTAALTLSADAQEAIARAEADIAELRQAWQAREISTTEFREMRATRDQEIRAARGKTTRRPTVKILEGMVGPNARPSWARLKADGEFERMNAILRFLFTAVIIDGSTARGTVDYSRIRIEASPL